MHGDAAPPPEATCLSEYLKKKKIESDATLVDWRHLLDKNAIAWHEPWKQRGTQGAILSIIHTPAFVQVMNCENVIMNKGQRVDMPPHPHPPRQKSSPF